MKKSHKLMIPLLAVISISVLLGAIVVSAKVNHGPCTNCGCGDFTPHCCDLCGGRCLGIWKGRTRGKRPEHTWPWGDPLPDPWHEP